MQWIVLGKERRVWWRYGCFGKCPRLGRQGFTTSNQLWRVCLCFCLFVLCVFIFYCVAWQKSNDPGTFSLLTIEKFQIVHRTFNRRLFFEVHAYMGNVLPQKSKPLAKITFQWPHQFAHIVPPLHAQSGNSLIFISWYPDPSGCRSGKVDV